jgi:hypothetical protein
MIHAWHANAHAWSGDSHAKICKDMHGVEIAMQRYAKTHIKYHGKMPWARKPLTVNPTMTKSTTL